MKRYFMLLLLCSYYTINGQVTSDEKISIEFSDATALEVIETIEKQTEYRFFFIESWLSTERISGSYNDVKITELLEALFGKSVINYYISEDKKIVLTNNVLIRDSLPLGFFDYIDQNNTTEDNFAPVFYSDKDESDGSIETIRIGKEKKGSGNKKYTLSGYARNTSTKKPIENLAIVVQDKNVYAVTNAQGFYTIELPIGANVIEAKALGFENLEKRVVIYSDGTYNFMLKEDAETLEEV
ncbi:MAG: carboxypeptidase-like regulatory domain-containing protein, partial [Flavobacteriaceae bacterium]|nr:carboxypeptidase-like regulatory domain-containing protein [Flavobacteriaceae bacterium]